MCEKMSVYAGEKRDQVNILRLCCGCGVCGVFACCGCGVCGVFAAVLPRQYLHSRNLSAMGVCGHSDKEICFTPFPRDCNSILVQSM